MKQIFIFSSLLNTDIKSVILRISIGSGLQDTNEFKEAVFILVFQCFVYWQIFQ